MPPLRENGFLPAFYRITYDKERASPIEQLLSALGAPESPSDFPFVFPSDPASQLWIYLHRLDLDHRISHLILDQFEEVFTIAAERPGTEEEVRQAIGMILQGAVPAPIRPFLSAEEKLLEYFSPDSAPLRLILAIRDDHLYALNRWRGYLPQLGQNFLELQELDGTAAFEAVYEPGALRTKKRSKDGKLVDATTELLPLVGRETAQRIVRFVAGAVLFT